MYHLDCIMYWELLVSMKLEEVTLVVQRSLEKHPKASPEVMSDNNGKFRNKDFKQLIKRFMLVQIKISEYYQELDNMLERFHRNLREWLAEGDLRDLGRAQKIICKWVA